MSSSRDWLRWAKVDTGLMSDAKVLRLARKHRDESRTMSVMGLYMATLLASWKDDKPVPLVDAAPGWWLGDMDAAVADLTDVGLLDESGAIPAETLNRWMASVRAQSEGGALGAARRWAGDRGASGTHSLGRQEAMQIDKREREIEGRERVKRERGEPRPLSDIIADLGQTIPERPAKGPTS